MELYGSLSNISGSVSASYFTGSYIGDGAGLYNLPASGVTGLNLSQIASGSVTASVNPSGFNVNTSASITGSLNVSGTVLSQTTPLVSGSSQINITGTTGYSTFSSSIATTDSNQESRLNLIETSTGSLNSFSSSIDTTIKNKLNIDGVISGSSQILNGSNIVSSSAQVSAYGFATTGSNLFIGTQTHSGSILPSVDNAYDLGSATYQWRDVYISSGSLYIDGTKVIGSTAQELTITTDTGQSIKILEGTTDSIILQTADGDIELKSSADGDILLDPTNGKIMLKGPIEILNGQKIQSSVGGTPVVFANDIVVSGSIDITGTIEGINLTDFSSSLNARLGTLETSTGSLNSFTSSTNSRLTSIETSTSSLNSYTSSNNTRLNTIESTTGSLNSYTSSTNTKLSSIETTTSSIISVNTTQNSRLDSLETTSGSILTTNTAQSSRLDSIEGKTGSYATTGSNIFQGTQTITGSLYISQDLVVAGSSSIQNISSSIVNIADNIITVNALNPSVRFGGLAVIDSGSNPQVSGSMLFDSVNNQWIFVHQNQGTVTSSVLLMGPETYDNLGNEAYITTNRLIKSTGIEHLTNSNISDDGTTVTILSNTVINGTLSATGTTLVSGSSQINHNTTTNYVANQHIDHTTVSITAGNGLSGGGDISTTRTLSLDTTSATFTNGVKSKMNTEGVVSGSSQIAYGSISGVPSGIVSGSSQVSFNGITDKPTLVSGSSQITYGSISGIPGGIVSGSVQVDLTATTNYSSGIKTRLNAEGVLSGSAQVVASLPAGTVSGSSQITYGSISGIPSGIVSGSSQISFGSISGVPSGLVSGSSQITLSSTTGYGSVLNQAVLTTSTPTFAELTITSNQDGKLTLRVPSTGDSNDWNYINFVGANGTRDMYFGTDSSGNPTWYRDDNGVNIALGSVATVNGTQIVTNSGTWNISISGNSATSSNSSQLGGYSLDGATSVATRIFNNKGQNHNTNQNFNSSMTPGPNYMQQGTNGPTGTASHQWYGFMFGLGGEYGTTTGSAGHYASQLYYARAGEGGGQYLWARDMEGGSWGSWRKLHAGYADTAGTAGNITAYTINQNVGTGNAPTFAGLDLTSRLYLNGGSYEGSILFGSSTTWRCGIRQHDDADAELRIWTVNNNGMIFLANGYNGEPADISRPTDGLVVGPGNNVGIGNFSSSDPGYKLQVNGTGYFSGNLTTAAYVLVGGSYSNNAYNSVGSSRLMFGGGDSDAVSNYYIGTNLENYGGNYTKLDLRWHTGIRMGAQAGYGGIRFFNNEDLDSVLFSIGAGDGNVRSHTNLYPSASGSYNLGSSSLRWANVYTNDLHLSNEGKEGGNDVDGTTGNWTIQEGNENLYIINNKNGKKFKIDLTEIV